MSLAHITLGLLRYRQLSGYDLNKAFRASVYHFWNTDQSQIYRALHRLAEAGLVEVETVVQDGLPNKKLYQITEAGRAEFARWLAEPLPPETPHEAWLGQLFFGAASDPATLAAGLEARAAALRQQLAVFTGEIPASAAAYAEQFNTPDDLPFWQATLAYGIERLEFDIAWAERMAAQFRAQAEQA